VTLLRGLGVAAAFAAGVGAQAWLQADLGRANRVRSVRQLHSPPSPWGLRIAAGGLEEAAADALWLTVLPRLGVAWGEPDRKAAWIERATEAMIAANPRSLTPTLYAACFLERIDRGHPGIERLLRLAMDAEADGERVNADSWELPHDLGMNHYMRYALDKRAASLEEARRWLRVAAAKPECPTMIIEFLAELERREGNELEGWRVYLQRAGGTANPSWREWFLREADGERARIVAGWCRRAEEGGRPFPATAAEAQEFAAPEVRRLLASAPALREDLLRDVVVEAGSRFVFVPSVLEFRESESREQVLQGCRRFEAKHGERPKSADEIKAFFLRGVPRHPRHGKRWEVDPGTGEPVAVDDPEDPRLRAPKRE
jgi:hypothetical protein